MAFNFQIKTGRLLWQAVLSVVILAAASHAQSAPDPLAQALAHKKSKQYAAGIRVLETALKQKGVTQAKTAQAHYVLGWLYVGAQQKAAATTHFQTALRNGLSAKEAIEARAAL